VEEAVAVVVVVVSAEALMLDHSMVRTRKSRLRSMRVGFSKVRSETVMTAVPPLLLAQNAYRTMRGWSRASEPCGDKETRASRRQRDSVNFRWRRV